MGRGTINHEPTLTVHCSGNGSAEIKASGVHVDAGVAGDVYATKRLEVRETADWRAASDGAPSGSKRPSRACDHADRSPRTTSGESHVAQSLEQEDTTEDPCGGIARGATVNRHGTSGSRTTAGGDRIRGSTQRDHEPAGSGTGPPVDSCGNAERAGSPEPSS